MHYHHKALTDSVQAERLAAAARRRPPTDVGELERMVHRAADGDAAAWDWLVNRFKTRVLRAARAQGLTHHDAEDAAQATWTRLFRHIGRIREPGSLATWLTTTARREGPRLRDRAPSEEPMGDPIDVSVAPDHDRELMAAARHEAIALALSELPQRHRTLMRALTTEPAPSYAH